MQTDSPADTLRSAWRQSQADNADLLAESQRLRLLMARTSNQIGLLEEHFQPAGRVAAFGHLEVDELHRVALSGSATGLLGVAAQLHPGLDSAFEHAAAADRSRLATLYANFLASGLQLDEEVALSMTEGGTRWLRLVLRRADQSSPGAVGLLVDITAAKLDALRHELLLNIGDALLGEADSEQVYSLALRRACEGLGWELGACWQLTQRGQGLRCLAVHAADGTGLSSLAQVMHGRVIDAAHGMAGAVLGGGTEMWSTDAAADERFAQRPLLERLGVRSAFSLPIVMQDGRRAGVLQFFSRAVRGPDTDSREIGGMIGSLLVQRALREAAITQLRDAAERDALTGLSTRYALGERMRAMIAAGTPFAVCVADLQRFRLVNQGLGREAGDLVLVTAAGRVIEQAGPQSLAARLGGDEFAALVPDPPGDGSISARLERAFSEPFHVGGYEIRLGANCGVSRFPVDGSDAERLLREADARRLRAKRPGPPERVLLAPLDQLRMEQELRRALAGAELAVHYQPIVRLGNNTVAGVEALVRWQHPQRGLLLPAAFLDVAGEAGLMREIGVSVIEMVVDDIARASSWLPADWRFNVNLTAFDFRDYKLFSKLGRVLGASGVDPRHLRFEITEGTLMEDLDGAERVMALLATYGVEFAIDDFGTGFSSLAQLARLAAHELKIDASFTRNMGNPRGAAVVRAILDLAARLEMPVTAEGVETAAQAEALARFGCAKAQGYLYAPALPFDTLQPWLAAFAHSPSGRVPVAEQTRAH